MKNKKLLITTFLLFGLFLTSYAFDYIPKDVNANPFGDKIKTNQLTEQAAQPEMREIRNLTEYFRYLSAEVHRHWTPFRSDLNYEVTVQFHINRNGTINDVRIVKSTNPNANSSVINAVKSATPYQPLPASYPNKDGVVAQVTLEYRQ